MKIFGTSPLVCTVCKVHFEGEPEFERWAEYCPQHRGPIMARDLLHDKVLAWCELNWESLVHHVASTDTKLLPLVEQAGDTIHLPPNTKLIE